MGEGTTRQGDGIDQTYLVNQEPLAFRRVKHFLRIFRHERVKECVEPLVIPALGTEDPAESLCFLTTRSEM